MSWSSDWKVIEKDNKNLAQWRGRIKGICGFVCKSVHSLSLFVSRERTIMTTTRLLSDWTLWQWHEHKMEIFVEMRLSLQKLWDLKFTTHTTHCLLIHQDLTLWAVYEIPLWLRNSILSDEGSGFLPKKSDFNPKYYKRNVDCQPKVQKGSFTWHNLPSTLPVTLPRDKSERANGWSEKKRTKIKIKDGRES